MYTMDVNTMGSQSVHSVLWLNWGKKKKKKKKGEKPEDD